MKKPFLYSALMLVGLGGGALLAIPVLRPGARSQGSAPGSDAQAKAGEHVPGWKSRWETLKAQAIARLDELEQREEELDYQHASTTKAEAALAVARHELDVAQRALREYEAGTARQEREQVEGELALAQADYKAAADQSEHRPRPAGDLPPPPSANATFDEQFLPRAKLALEQVRLKRETLIHLTQPRRTAELARDVDRVKDDVALKHAALEQEREDEKKLRSLLDDDALEADERRALALLAEVGRLTDTRDSKAEARFNEAAALWTSADHARTARRDAAAVLRFQKASKPDSSQDLDR